MPESLLINKSSPIRKFDLPSLNSQIDKAIASIEPGKTGMVVAVVDNKKVELAILGKQKLGNGDLAWTLVASDPWDGKPDFEGQIRYSW